MQCVANYEIKSDVSVIADDLPLKLQHPKGLYRARIQNITRADFSAPFLLSLHLTFDAPSLDEACSIADERLADCLNMLAFTTGSSFSRHRIRQIVDCTPGIQMRSCLMWGDSIGHEDPQPFLNEEITNSIVRLLAFDVPPAIRRALRWYRRGINAMVPDDQFQYFWFALEIVAEFQKSTGKVHDKCPHCQSPLYCESCKKHPAHKPYAKQAIRSLLKAVDKDCEEATIEALDKTRNGLMHGATLKEIEVNLLQPQEEIVDVLGRLLFKALVNQFPREIFKEKLVLGTPSTYVHRTMHGIAHIQTVVPMDADGELDLSFKGTQLTMVTDGPPQSALPSIMAMTPEQHKRLGRLSYENGDHQEMCRRIFDRVKSQDDRLVALVLSTDMARIQEAMKRGDTGSWQDLFREIIQGTCKS